MATDFTVNKADLEFILRQIRIAEATSAAYTPAPISDVQAIVNEYGVNPVNAALAPFGLRAVGGSNNNLVTDQTEFGAIDNLFPRLTDPVFRNEGDDTFFGAPFNNDYGLITPGPDSVVDADPRIISNLIVDMSIDNPAAIAAYLGNPLSLGQFEADHPGMTPVGVPRAEIDTEAEFDAWMAAHPGERPITDTDLQTIPNQSPDIGLSPGFNSWMTFFGQFFDHGLDLVSKGGNGTVYIPLQADDPLYDFGGDSSVDNGAGTDTVDGNADDDFVVDNDGFGADGVRGTADDSPNFMALTRATVTLVDGVPQHENTTTSFVDQNQTYTSHASHQVFLREYVKNAAGDAVSTGKMLDGSAASGSVAGAIGNWAEVKAQALEMLGIVLTDFNVNNVPLLKTDQYGKFIPGPNGYAQVATVSGFVEGTAAGLTLPADTIFTNHAFLNDIAHHAAVTSAVQPADADVDVDGDGVYDPGDGDILTDVNGDTVIDGRDFFADDHANGTYDNELLNAHMVTGDGRGNENIALMTVHSIFHSEHNRLVDVNKATILAAGATDIAFLNQWLLDDVAAVPADPSTLVWDGDRLFQAARFGTEMQYQHMVFEEFARRIQPMVDPFIFNTSPNVDASVVAEFAHTVYRFGHSMLTGTVDRLTSDLQTVDGGDQKTLLAVFLNPQQYLGSGDDLATINANIIRGLSRDVGNAMDEFIVTNVRSQLLGLPLDLAVLNLARGRDTGIPSLNQTRAQLYDDTGFSDLKPYTSWQDFALNIKHPASIINFIAAYGTHSTITSATTVADKRLAAEELVFGVDGDDADALVAGGVGDRVAFLTSTGAWENVETGLNVIDLWIGGLAEKSPEFGGMLGTTFNYVFEFQMESLQFGDRFYYLTRTQGTNFLNNLEPNTFADIVMRNTDLGDQYSTHLYGQLFVTPDHIIELDRGIAQTDYNGVDDPLTPGEENPGDDPTWDGSNPIMEAILGPKVVRGYGPLDVPGYAGNGDGLANGHDEGGYLRVIGGEHFVLGGTEGADIIYGDSGMDTIWGDGGNDYLNGGTEADDVFGGAGDDIIEDPFGEGDVLRGNDGNDVITAAGGADLLFGNAGQDYLVLGADAAEVFGGEGTDFILGGAGKDFILGNEGSDWIEGGAGFDTLAGENSELFFNSPIIGHDVLMGQGDETDYDSESGDDIMTSGSSVFRYEGMHGFDWGIGKGDLHSGVNFDLFIPVFTTVPEDILRDRFDSVEGLSGWKYSDVLDGDDRGHKGGGSSAPDSTPEAVFTNNILTQEGIDRITGMEAWMGDAIGVGANAGVRQTLFNFASVGGSQQTSYRDGNILMGGDGNDFLRGRGGYDVLDGDAWLNVRIKIVIPAGDPFAGTYSAESMNTDTSVAGEYAGKVYNTNPDGSPNFNSVAFGGRSLTSLMLDRTINPGDMSIVREILYDNTNVTGAGMNIDTAIFQGTLAEYEIEGLVTEGINNSGQIVNQARDLNGDGFIFVRDKDNGATGATITGPDGEPLTFTSSRGALTDDFDLLKNIEQLIFADATLQIGGPNQRATGTVTIADPTPHLGLVTPYVGQVLVPTLSGLVDLDTVPIDPATGMPVGLNFEWQTTETGGNAGWSLITTGLTYTVRSVDPGHILRAVAVFQDNNGVAERIYSVPTSAPTAASSVNENSLTDTVVMASIPFNPDYDPDSTLGGVTDGDIVALTHYISPGQDAGGRFKVVQQGSDLNGVPIFKVMVGTGGPLLDYELQDAFQVIDNQYQIVIDSYTDSIENGGLLLATRQFTIMLNDVVDESAPVVYAPTDINWNGVRPGETTLPATGVPIANLTTVDIDNSSPVTFSKVGGDANFVVTGAGAVSRTGGLATNTTYVLNVRAEETSGAFVTKAINIRTGTTGNNTITGSALTDIIYGLGGSDTLNGGIGNDTLFGQDGNDTLNGGAGNDDLTGGDDNDTINGGAGNDTIRYTVNNNDDDSDVVDGGGNIDTLMISGTDNLLTVSNETLDVVFDGTSITEIEGGGSIVNVESVTANLGAGTGDTLSYADTTVDVTVNLTTGTASGFTSIVGIENVTGGSGNDTLIGIAGSNNALTGGNGNDTFTVHDAGDTVSESNGNAGGIDTVLSGITFTITDADVENLTLTGSGAINGTGNASANVITGNSGNNTLSGLDGNDTLIGGLGNDTLNGGNQIDTASYADHATGVTVSLAVAGPQDLDGLGVLTESDTLIGIENLTGGAGNDTLTGNTSANVLSGSGGNDTLIATIDNVRDTMDGGANTDTANYAAYAAALTVNLGGAAPIVVTGSGTTVANSDVLVAIENFIGGSGVNNLTGNAAVNTLTGGAANDILSGGGGNDILFGLGGNDIFNFAIGDQSDTIDGGADSDTLNISDAGGSNTLTVNYNGTAITNFQGQFTSVTSVETFNANLGGGTDTLAYNTTSNLVVNLGAATPTATGFASISGIENVTGGSGADTLTGSGVANTLNGGAGIDTLNGGAGGDILIGGDGADIINTGAADDNVVDIVRFNAATEFGDIVSNFDANGTADEIEFGGLLNTAYDDGNSNDNFLFASGNGLATTVNATVGQGSGDIEALYLSGGIAAEGVINTSLLDATAVANAFNAEFNITAANGEDALLVINDTNGTSASLWQWVQAGGGEIAAAEITLIGTINANATVTTASFDFF